MRSAIHFLPETITAFAKLYPEISITPKFNPLNNIDDFLKVEQNIVFAQAEDVIRIPDIQVHPLFESKIYLITEKGDPLTEKSLLTSEDLKDRTLMVEGGSHF